jgi:hypothetical protein
MPRHTQVTPAIHSAGATVLHRSPFADLEVPVASEPLSNDIRHRWVKPFYMSLLGEIAATERNLRLVFREIEVPLIVSLLSEFDWRPRMVGAFFVALNRVGELENHIGRLLLRSDVCYAGRGYCLALARLNTPVAVEYIRAYLRYYLTRKDLWFDQDDAMAALCCLDAANATTYASEFESLWTAFVSDKLNWNLQQSVTRFGSDLSTIATLQIRCDDAG